MRLIAISLMLVSAIFTVSGCTQEKIKYVCPDGTTVDSADLCTSQNAVQTDGNVKCSNSGACPNGYCDMSSSDPNDWHCSTGSAPESYCGDGICNPNGENFANCPQDFEK